jgi:hypothetical protein
MMDNKQCCTLFGYRGSIGAASNDVRHDPMWGWLSKRTMGPLERITASIGSAPR